MSEEKKEYIVTLWKHDDLNDLYDNMESPSGDTVIPKRTVECTNKRNISRNTQYLLTEEEANNLKNDSRVRDVRLPLTIDEKELVWQLDSSSNFPKTPNQNTQNYQWGLLAHSMHNGGFGVTDTSNHPNQILDTNGQDGLGVDIVIADGTLDDNHPEFRENADGTGSKRANRYDWIYNCEPTTWPGASGVRNYLYPTRGYFSGGYPQFSDSVDVHLHAIGSNGDARYYWMYSDDKYHTDGGWVFKSNNNHASHVASTAAGNRQGWAKKANIYNINPMDMGDNDNIYDPEISSGMADSVVYDLVRDMHRQKLNSNVKGTIQSPMPTIMNNSWHAVASISFESGTFYLNYRGTVYSFDQSGASDGTVFNNFQDFQNWMYTKKLADAYKGSSLDAFNGWLWQTTARIAYYDSDFEDCIDDGIIIVSAANNYGNIFTSDPNDPDYNNWVGTSPDGSGAYYYNQGGSIMHVPDSILCVGSVTAISPTGTNTSNNNLPYYEKITDFSATGNRVDVFAAGDEIIGSVNGNADTPYSDSGFDFRNPNMPNAGRSYNWGNTVPVFNYVQGTDGESNLSNISCGHTTTAEHDGEPLSTRGRTGAYYSMRYYSGTSMASPQACGVAALAIEKYRNFNAEDVKKYIHSYAQKDRIYDDPTNSSRSGLNGAKNNFLMFHMERRKFGMITPEVDFSYRRQKEDLNYPYLPQISTATHQPGLKWPRVPRYMTPKFRNIHYFPTGGGGDIANPNT
tara:strand:- start:1633 stop:3849 length:2217 start_codon:yes stop_codon:yes gene_type:complete